MQLSRDIEIINKLGMHARAAAKFVKLASTFSSQVEIERAGRRVNGKSIMGVMMLAAEMGSQFTIRAEGEDEKQAVEAMISVIEDKFYEE
ncbi:MAG: HPr family phosphocarrier protein [Candidatus Latescibacteria bacterium]|nr:HPr family phosphocarrier protein [Candidatus Latescibacterota bacterium]